MIELSWLFHISTEMPLVEPYDQSELVVRFSTD